MSHTRPLGDVLADKTIGVLVGPAFPGIVGRGEAHPGDGRHGIRVLAEQGQGVSFGGGDLCVHGRLHSLGGELKSTSLTGHRFPCPTCCT